MLNLSEKRYRLSKESKLGAQARACAPRILKTLIQTPGALEAPGTLAWLHRFFQLFLDDFFGIAGGDPNHLLNHNPGLKK